MAELARFVAGARKMGKLTCGTILSGEARDARNWAERAAERGSWAGRGRKGKGAGLGLRAGLLGWLGPVLSSFPFLFLLFFKLTQLYLNSNKI